MRLIVSVLIVAGAVARGPGLLAQSSPRVDHMEHRFDDPERYAKSFDDPSRDEWQLPGRVLEVLDLRPGQVVADVGAGTGYFTVRLARLPARPRVYAVDVEPAMVDHVSRRAAEEGLRNIVAIQATSEQTNLPEPVDLVLIVDTYHHLPNRAVYFTELKKLMKPSARLAILDFRKGAPGGPPDDFRFSSAQIDAELEQAGFVLHSAHDFLPRQLFVIYRPK